MDTSIWIDLFSNRPSQIVPAAKMPFLATCPPIIQEVLQGIRENAAFQIVSTGMKALTLFDNPMSLELYCDAAKIYRDGRSLGKTIRSSTDCLIAAIAIKHDLIVWHKDRDFELIAKYCPLNVTRSI